jgi:hypothetical protein
MVKHADLIKSDSLSDTRKAINSANAKNRKYEKIPIYPSKIQTTAFPEKAYIFAIEKLILISIILFAFSVVMGFAIYYKTFLFKPNPWFLYYSDYDNKFETKNAYNGNTKPIYLNTQILAEDFLQKWIHDYYSIYPDKNTNEKKWCDCLIQNRNGQVRNFKDGECSICTSSDASVYSVFAEFTQPVMQARLDKKIVRLVKILNVKPFLYSYIDYKKADTSLLQGLTINAITSFLGSMIGGNKFTPFSSHLFYIKVDFMIVDFHNEHITNKEFFTTYNTVNLQLFQDMFGYLGVNGEWNKRFKILEHSANFILHDKYKNTDTKDLETEYKILMKEYDSNAVEVLLPAVNEPKETTENIVVEIAPQDVIIPKQPISVKPTLTQPDIKPVSKKPTVKKTANNPAGVVKAPVIPVKRSVLEARRQSTNRNTTNQRNR